MPSDGAVCHDCRKCHRPISPLVSVFTFFNKSERASTSEAKYLHVVRAALQPNAGRNATFYTQYRYHSQELLYNKSLALATVWAASPRRCARKAVRGAELPPHDYLEIIVLQHLVDQIEIAVFHHGTVENDGGGHICAVVDR